MLQLCSLMQHVVMGMLKQFNYWFFCCCSTDQQILRFLKYRLIGVLKLHCQANQIYCRDTFTLQNDKVHIRKPIPTIYSSEICTGVLIFTIFFNKRLNRSHSVSVITNDRSRDRHLMSDRRCESCCKLRVSHYCTAEREHFCINLYML